MIWKNRILKFIIFINLLSSSGIYGKDKIFLNHPVGIDDRIRSRFSKKPISGIVYRSFDNQNLQPKPVGELYSSVKAEIWTGWWGNGNQNIIVNLLIVLNQGCGVNRIAVVN